MRLVLGVAEKGEAAQLLEHASACEACGSALAASLHALEGNPSPEEAAAIAELAAGRKAWESRLAAELATTRARRPGFAGLHSILRDKRWMAAAAVAAGVAVALTLILWQRQASAPEYLLAMAYQQSRTLELRIPDAGYAAVTAGSHTRGAVADNEPAPLLEARAGLARKLQRSPQDGHWLELQARADVLEERYDSAVDVLDRLVAAGPVTAELLTDAAAAYYQRGLVSGRELDRSTALDYLRRADEMAPADPVILFNEAIVMEDRGQMMNAVEVWNRYITVERDAKWTAEGKRKLAALEQTLNRLKSHESRIRQMLATPESMDALAGDAVRLAALDEELSSIQLDQVLGIAYPGTPDVAGGAGQARGSPCALKCQAARRLLQAIAHSLEIHHNDYWLTELLSFNFNALPMTKQAQFTQAMQLLGQATREDQTGSAAEGAILAYGAHKLFADLKNSAGPDLPLRTAAEVGEDRAAMEYLFALQRKTDFKGCRAFAQQTDAEPGFGRRNQRHTWMQGMWLITEKVCDDSPETRIAGRKLQSSAERLTRAANYPLLMARIRARIAGDALNSGDYETFERVMLSIFRELVAADPPPFRVFNTVLGIPYAEQDSPRAHMAELSLRESVRWAEEANDRRLEAEGRVMLAGAEMRIGAMAEAENQLSRAYERGDKFSRGKSNLIDFGESEIVVARWMLERGDLVQAGRFLSRASAHIANDSDTWLMYRYAAALGQLELSRKEYDRAAGILKSNIRTSEGKDLRGGDRAAAAEYAAQDHDLYAELAATWLAQGRPAAQVLGLWERFRMRSRGMPVLDCGRDELGCEQASLLAEQHRLGSSLLIGQIVLLDRVLIYRMDSRGITWSEQPVQRQEVLDAAQTLERSVSSPFTSTATARQLGARLSDSLLARLPANLSAKMGPDAALLLEPDPMLQNLPWPVLPTPAGPLGLQYPLAELPSILVMTRDERARTSPARDEHALVVGASLATEGAPPLPEALTEAQAVNDFLHEPELLLGEQATAARMAQEITTATLFHFAGHAVQSSGGTELLLAPASPDDQKPWVDGAFLRQHPPRACRLAVLSACATGKREAAWNHPLQDIVETLSSLGVPEVVATRWQIDSEAAVPFMESLYHNLQQDHSVAWALTAARQLESQQPLYSNPYYWGAYYVTGRETTHLSEEFHAGLQAKIQGKERRF